MKRSILLASTISLAIAAGATRPNIVLFMVDDMGWQDTSVPFDSMPTPLNNRYHTPNMERLARMGMKFTSAYACAISSPSRCSLLTGMNQARHRVTNWTMNRDRMTDDPLEGTTLPDWNYNGIQPTDSINNSAYCTPLPALLRGAGYSTIHVGKAHFGAFGTPSADPCAMGFDINIAGSAAGGPPQGGYLGSNRYGHHPDGSPISQYAIESLEDYWDTDVFLTDALTRKAIKAVDSVSVAAPDKPFFLYMSHYAVHVPFDPDSRYIDNYATLDVKEQQYAALIEGMDRSLGDILDYLEQSGQADNTIVIFMSDNGGLDFYARGATPPETDNRHNYPLRSGKGSAYEGGVREPMIVSWPGVTAPGSVNSSYLIIEDFFPTILNMAGIDSCRVVQTVDGENFVRLLHGETADSNRALYWNTPNNWTNMIDETTKRRLGIGPTCAIRRGRYKLIYRYVDRTCELYEIESDLAEEHDLAQQYPDIVSNLATELSDYLRSVDAQRPADTATGLPYPWPDQKK